MRTCSMDGCGRPHFGRGLCRAHYNRLARHGSPTSGGAARSARGAPLAWLKAHVGHVGDECLIWPFKRNSRSGRAAYTGCNIVRVMCEAAHGAPPAPEHHAAHSCGKGHEGCINPVHLRWATAVENHADKHLHGTQQSRLRPEQVREIRSLRGLATQRALAERFGVSESTVRMLLAGHTWKALS